MSKIHDVAAKTGKKLSTADVYKLANMAQTLKQQRDAQKASVAPPAQTGSALGNLMSLGNIARQELASNPELRRRVETSQPRSFADFNSAQELYDYRLQNTRENADGNAVSKALQADIDALDRRRKELEREQWYHTADEMERINAQYSPEDAVYSAQQIADARELERLPEYASALELAYYRQLEKERQTALDKALSPYRKLSSNADYYNVVQAAMSKEQPKYQPNGLEQARAFMGGGSAGFNANSAKQFESNLSNPALWAAQNSEELLKRDAQYGSEAAGLSTGEYLYMTDEELQTYTYLVETQGRKAADEYFDLLRKDLQTRRQEYRYTSQAEWAKEHPWAASFASFGTSLLQPIGYIGNAVDYLGDGEVDPNSIWNAPAQVTSAFREGATSNLYNDYNIYAQKLAAKQLRGETVTQEELSRLEELEATANVLSFLSNTGYSIGDNLTTMLLGGGGTGSALLMGGEAAGATTYQALRSGKTAEQALAEGGVSALVESATERWSLGNLKALATSAGTITKGSVKSFIKELGKNMAKQGLAEASEEAVSAYANTVYDILVNGENSEYNQYYVSLLMQGVPADEAEALTQQEFFFTRPGESALSGGLSGMFFGGGGTVVGGIQNRITPEQQAAASTLAGITQREQSGSSTVADTVAEKVLTGQTPSNSEIRQLQNSTTTIQRSFEAMTGIEVVGVDSSNLRASIAAAVKNPTITADMATQVRQGVEQMTTPHVQNTTLPQAAPQYNTLNYNAPDASAIGTIDAARQGGAPLDVATAQDTGSAAGLAEDFRQRQVAQREAANNGVSLDTIANDRVRNKAKKLDRALETLGISNAVNASDLSSVHEVAAEGVLNDIVNSAAREIASVLEGTPRFSEVQERASKYGLDVSSYISEVIKVASGETFGVASRGDVNLLRDVVNNPDAVVDSNTSVRSDTENANKTKGGDALVDAEGNRLSQEQIDFFKNSKVRDKNGKLLRMYHGTSEFGFNVFDLDHSRWGLFGPGFYFTSDSGEANWGYAQTRDQGGDKGVYETYVNITNPVPIETELTRAEWDELFNQLSLDEPARSALNRWLNRNTSHTIENFHSDMVASIGLNSVKIDAREWLDAMRSRGWDGVIKSDPHGGGDNNVYAIAFDPSQVKRTDNRNPTENADIRFRLTGNQYNAIALYDALEADALSNAKLANLTAQLRDKLGDSYPLGDNPSTYELLEAVSALEEMEPDFILNVTERAYKTAEQKAAEKAAREKAAADRAERKRLADEEKQRKAAEAEQKKAAIAEHRAKAEKTTKENTKKAAKNAAPKATRQKSIASLAAEHKTGTAKVSGYNVNLTDPKAIARSLEGDARTEFVRQMESVNEFGKAFGHTVNYYYGRVGDVGSDTAGFYYNGKIYVNVNSLRAAGLITVAHEICHDIAAQEPSFVNSFYRLYREYCESNGMMNEFNRRWNEIYNNAIYPNKQLAIAEEVLAEMFGERASSDSEFLNYCLGKRPGIIARIVEAFNRILTKLHLKKYSKASADAMELRNFLLGTAARYQMNQTGREMKLSAGIRSDYRNAQRKAEAIGDRYVVFDDRGVNLTEWDTTGLAAPSEYKNLKRKAPDEVTNYGFKYIPVSGERRNVLIVNPTRYVTEGVHADMVASSRSLAAALGIRLGFISGDTSTVIGEGKNTREQVIDRDFVLADDGTVYINLDSEIPYTKIVAGAWWSQFRKSNPAAAADLERLAERSRKLSGDDRIAQDYAVGMLTRTNAQGLKALNMTPETLVERLSDRAEAVYAFAHERPGIMRKLFENAGDMVAKLSKKQDYRAAYISGQLQARLMKAFSETSPNRPGGDKIETAKRKTAPEGVRFMYAGENAQTANRSMLKQAQDMIDAGVEPETVRQETGWFKGVDGRWRFEIDDSKAQYYRAGDARFSRMHADYARHQTLLNKMLNGQISSEEHAELRELNEIWGRERGRLNERVDRGNATLDEILDHEALFEAYPELRNVKVRFEVMYDGERGKYDRKTNTITLHSDLRNAPEGTLLHEIQHAVQSIEGHSGGASPFYWASEISAEEITRRLDEERREILSSLDRSDANKYARFEDLDLAMETMLAREDFEDNFDLQDRYEKLEAESDELYRELHSHEWFRRLQDIRRQHDNPSEIYRNMYHNTAGEIEARDTAARRLLTPEQRKKNRPDIDRKDVVFADSGLGNSIVDNNTVLREPTRTDPVDTYKRRDLRAKISKEVKELSAALVTPSDKKHIPPKLTAAIADFLKEFTNDTSVFTAAKLAVLRDAYDRLSDTGVDSDMDVSYAYDPDISETISELSDTIDGRRLAQLNMGETVKVRSIVQHFRHLVTSENKLFLEGRKRDVAALGSDIMTELRQRPAARTKAEQGTFKAFTDMLTSGNITPAYFFKRIGGTMESLFKSMRSGQNVWASNMRQAQQTYESIFKKYHADKWLNKRNDTLTFTTERGDNITLTRQQALTLYATHQREVTNQIQEAGHLSLGGFVYEDAVKTRRGEESVDTTKAHPLNTNDMRRIIDWLTDDQIKFADELVGYMSGELARLGNEASLKLHGWEKFTESYYFPYNSAENYLYTKQAVTEDRRLKYMSFTKSTVRKANNPIVLSDFTQVWANHVQNMLMYSSLAVPLEDFNRVYNYKTSVTEDSTSRSVKEALEKAYGKNANAYIRQLMTDINGGVTPPRSEGFFNRMMSKFRKSAVFASASVVVQQPSAIGRAMALIDPKYFVASTFQRKNWEECKRWCGVALIKEMGRFDTSTGRGAASWLIAQPYRGVQKVGAFFTDGDFRDDVLSAPAAKADAYTWSAIWNACKREAVREKGLQPNSEELFKAAAERFDEVINFTQVYDSVFARSELMRSKSGLTKAMTAFMSEPTVTYNMLLDSVMNARRSDVKSKVNPARAVGAFVLSATINAVLKSIVTALREEDEDKTYIEKYLGELVENFESDTNLLSLIPYVRDLLSLAKGYSVENTAYDVPKDFIEAGGDILEWIEANIAGNDTNVDINTALLDLGDAISAGFGIPVKNIRRDVESIYNTVYSTKPLSETSKAGILDSILSKTQYYDNRKTANYGRLVDAYMSGDADKAADIVDRLLVSGTEESSIVRGTKSVVKTEYLSGRISNEEAIKFLIDHGNTDADDAYWLIQEWEYNSTKGDNDPNFSKYMRLRDALDADDKAEIHDAAVELLEHGVSVKTLKSETKKHAGSSSILYRSGLADYLNEDKEKGSGGSSGGSGGRSSGGSSGRSSAKSAATSLKRGAANDAGAELSTIKPASSQTLRKPTTQSGGRVNTDSSNGSTVTGGTDPTIPSAGQSGIFNAGCANNENGSCRIGRTSCENCPYATNK